MESIIYKLILLLCPWDVNFCSKELLNIVYVIESAVYGVLFTSCLWIQPRTKHFLCRELFITRKTRIFLEIVFWTQIRNKNSLQTIEPNANLISTYDMHELHERLAWKGLYAIFDWLYFHTWKSCTPFWLTVEAFFFTCENKAFRFKYKWSLWNKQGRSQYEANRGTCLSHFCVILIKRDSSIAFKIYSS